MPKPTAIVYIDGLNVQRRLLEAADTEIWVNFQILAENLLQDYEVRLVRLFTSRTNVARPAIQDKYWSLLKRDCNKLVVEFGRMKTTARVYPIHSQAISYYSSASSLVKVRKIEEKGSDVSLGAHLVLDASRDLADVYVLMSCDTDFFPALSLVISELKVSIGFLIPGVRMPKLFATLKPEFVRYVDQRDMIESQIYL
jgi:uncharacterized LabA/DUF88 family protein